MPMNAAIIALLFTTCSFCLVFFSTISFQGERHNRRYNRRTSTRTWTRRSGGLHVLPVMRQAFWRFLVLAGGTCPVAVCIGVEYFVSPAEGFWRRYKIGHTSTLWQKRNWKTSAWRPLLILLLEAALFVVHLWERTEHNCICLHLCSAFYWMAAYTMNRERLRQLGFRRAYLLPGWFICIVAACIYSFGSTLNSISIHCCIARAPDYF